MTTRRIIGDRYQIERRLSKKAGRETVLAIDLETWTPVVLKILTFSPDFGWDDLKLFEREIIILQSLNHPCIPRYLTHFELDRLDSKGLVLVQSYVEGRSLEDSLKSGQTFSEAEVKQLAHAVLKILIYLHSQQPPIIHRDIKPANILLANRTANSLGQVYLVDFGSVHTLAAIEGGTMTIVGTYGYMPPEQFGGRTRPASDLYSLGATLIHLVTGHHPADIPQTQLRLNFDSLTTLNSDWRKWLRRMVEPGLTERFSSAQEALRMLLQPSEASLTANLSLSKRDLQRSSKPQNTQILVFRQPGWIDIIIPNGSSCPNPELELGYTRLYIDSQQISLSSSAGWHIPPSLRLAIVGLECHDRNHELDDRCLKILTTRHTYILGGDGSLTALELQWLATELSDWLGLPVVHC